MVRAWYMDDNLQIDQRLEHHRSPPAFIGLNTLLELGVKYFKFDLLDSKMQDELDTLKKERGYSYEDEIICSKECLSDYENKLKSFYEEHLHTDEEIRFVIEGSGYFDVRDAKDDWIRIEVEASDLIIIPAGIYHRFTLDTRNYIKAKRYFVGEPMWKPFNRPVDEMSCRKSYLECLKNGFR